MVNKYLKKNIFFFILIFVLILFLIYTLNTDFIFSTSKPSSLRSRDSIFINNKKGLKFLFKRKQFINENCYSAFNNFNRANLSLYATNKKSNCSEKDWIFLDYRQDHILLVYNYDYLNKNDIFINECKYTTVKWGKNDFDFKLSEAIKFFNGTVIKGNYSDMFIYIRCTSKISNYQYKTAFARILKDKDYVSFNNDNNKKPISIFMLGFDSVSRQLWLKNLPKSTNYLINVLNSTILNGYNIVGDGTPAALIPILTGHHEKELPNTLKSTVGSQFVDKAYPFVWNDFKNVLNYSTLHVEDWPDLGAFNYRLSGMSRPPVDHYLRPFEIFLDNNQMLNRNSRACLNERSWLNFHLDYAKDFMNSYSKNGFFGHMFISEYSHDSTNRLSMADDDLYNFLVYFKQNKQISDNTILILFADHGPRFSSNRKSIKGLLEERNAFFSIYLPSSFELNYKKEFDAFKSNANKLITPMDIHHTLIDFINMESNIEAIKINDYGRSKSLFKHISSNRTCNEAGISTHWCACLKRIELDVDENLNMIANKFIDFLNNNLLKESLNKCSKLELDKINTVYLLDSILATAPKRVIIKSPAKLNLLTPPPVEKDYEQYFFQIATKPNNGVYEFTAIYEFDLRSDNINLTKLIDKKTLNKFIINEESISRINKYGNDSHCIYEKFPNLRKYCFCK